MNKLEPGKLSTSDLQQLILQQLPVVRKDILVRPMIGEDSAVIDFGDEVCVVSTDPITGALSDMGVLAVHISCNDIAANGAQPVGIQASLLFPRDTEPARIKALMEDIAATARSLEVEVIGGHTEVTDVVNKPLVSVTAIGRASRDKYVTSAGGRVGDQVVITKSAALEGTSILAADYYQLLLSQGLDEELLRRAQSFSSEISVVREGLIAADFGVTAMHDATEGGVCGCLFELTSASGTGFEIWEGQVPLRQETRALARVLDFDPLTMISSGSMLITTPRGKELCARLMEEGVEARVIGRLTEEKRIIKEVGGGSREVTEVPGDELWRLLEKLI